MSDKDIYDSYFSKRSVIADFYDQYILPKYLKKRLPADKSAAILDIGCGFGQLISALTKEGFTDVEGVDISKEAIESCTSRQLNVVGVSDITDFCLNAVRKYDFIIMSHVLEHIEKPAIIETLKLIRQCLLKPGSSLAVMVPNAQSNTGSYWAYEDFTHHTIFTAGSLDFVLKSAGFESIEFLDPDGLEGSRLIVRWVKNILLTVYKTNKMFWNLVTNSSFHRPSPQIFTFELKVIAK